ncbi:pheromone-regulated protein prm4 [Saccharomyces pastorianus]|uniref:Pheromone-regulated protein prm4 n=1 Tax=Saccharomyces pastorianus TaxID=27292 RepID=A0A6C1EHQ2_SACPS|nr:pheromone-regulated protein prm4 [Saccharomyces pastorianus]
MITDSSILKKHASSKKSTRIVSLTLIFLGIVSFLVFTWDDSLEFYNNATGLNDSNDSNEQGSAKRLIYKLPNLLKTADGLPDKKENELNILKVKEEISHIQSEVEVDIPASAFESTTSSLSTAFQKDVPAPRTATSTVPSSSSSIILKRNINQKKFDPKVSFLDIINTSPAVLFIMSSQTDSVFLRSLLQKELEISPELAIVDLEKHSHGYELEKYIKQNKLDIDPSTSLETIHSPYLFLNGISVINNGIARDIIEPHSKGLLLSVLKSEARGNLLIEKKDIPSNS